MRQVKYIPSGGANDEDHDDGGDSYGDDQELGLGKEEREKIKWAQDKGEIHRAILFW